ncbi:LamG-like jellyroll fold domain-containing protein [Ekhidna lutea]|nr:LamG-like jellyroll fold domain-containing protein [Ekhidna lutea]
MNFPSLVRSTLVIIFISFLSTSFAQSGPGGVFSDLWLRADSAVFSDAGTTPAVDTDPVVQWNDVSGTGNNASVGGANPTFQIGGQNGRPYLSFSDDDMDFALDAFAFGSADRSVFVVAEYPSTPGSQQYFFSYGPNVTSQRYSLGVSSSDNLIVEMQGDGITSDNTVAAASPFIFSTIYPFGGGALNTSQIFINGTNSTHTGGAATPATVLTSGSVGALADNAGLQFNGDIYEVIYYGFELNAVERTIVENYLSAKYDIPISNDLYAGDLVPSGDFDFDVIGIGRDAGASHIESASAGLKLVDQSFLLDDGDYVIAGHSGTPNAFATTDLPANHNMRLARDWYIDISDATSNAGSIDLEFDLAEMGLSVPPNVVSAMLITRPGTSGAYTEVIMDTGIIGDVVEFFGVDVTTLVDGHKYTVAFTTENALNFDGTDDNVTITHDATLNLDDGAFTIEYWARPEVVDGNFRWIMSKSNTGNASIEFITGINSTNQWRFGLRGLNMDIVGTSTVVANQYYHIACVFDGSEARLYVNGDLEGTASVSGSAVTGSENIVIGARNAATPTQFFDGSIDEVRFWNTARTLQQIHDNAYLDVSSDSDLISSYNFNQGVPNADNSSNTSLPDVSNSNNGTLNNFTLNSTSSNWINSTAFDNDIFAPYFISGYPLIDNISTTGFDITVQLNEPGTYYYVVVPDGATPPSVDDVRAGTGFGGTGQLAAGNIAVTTPSSNFVLSPTGLTPNTFYDVYIVAQDDEGSPNVQSVNTVFDVTTEAGFVTTWVTSDGQITIPTTGGGYNYSVEWNNITNPGTNEGFIDGRTGDYTITGMENGSTYEVIIRGAFPRIYFNNTGDKDKIQTIEQWGDIAWTSMQLAFLGCTNLDMAATDIPDLSGVTNMSQMFRAAGTFTGDLSGWDVSTITDMSFLFSSTSFNGDISSWDVSSVTNMSYLFYVNPAFNQNISGWNTSAATNMSRTFSHANAFNQDISLWDVSGVTNMNGMFNQAFAFNQDISSWNVALVTNMEQMFRDATAFNANISGWNVATVSSIARMFQGASSFNQNLSGWDVNATDLNNMFNNATAFDWNIGSWDVTAVTNMTAMLDNSGISVVNYDSILNGWAAQSASLQVGVTLGATGLEYSSTGEADRITLTSAPSSWIISGDQLATPAAPTNFIAYATSSTEITLEWIDNATNETSYLIERADDYAFTTNVTTVLAAEPADTDSVGFAIGVNQPYYYRVTPVNGFEDASSQSAIKFATTEAFAGSTLSFTGNQHVTIADQADFQGDSITLEGWINTTSTTNFGRVIIKSDGATQYWSLGINWTGNTGNAFATVNASSTNAIAIGTSTVNDGSWHHLAATFDYSTQTVNLYVNGTLEDTQSFTGTPSSITDGITIGNLIDGSQPIGGALDEIKVWGTIKSDFTDRYTPLQGDEPDLIAYYPMDEGTGATNILDASVNTNDGLLQNGPVYNPSTVVQDGVVSNTNDSGPGSLRAAINYANANSPTTITFNIPGGGPHSIGVLTTLPDITAAGTIIDGTSQPGWTFGDVNNMVAIDGSGIGSNSSGLNINEAADVEIYGLIITGFSGLESHAAIELTGDGADNAIIGAPGMGNIIHGGGTSGIYITHSDSTIIRGNWIGTLNGTTPSGNNHHGISATGTINNLIIGGNSLTGEGNIISGAGNGKYGITTNITGTNLSIKGNLIGTDSTGNAPMNNEAGGVDIGGAVTFVVGGVGPGERNIISGNNTDTNADGINIGNSSSGSILNNYIGVGEDGSTPLGNGGYGILFANSASNVLVDGNTISNNGTDGIYLGNGSSTLTVSNNIIGLTTNGLIAQGNTNDGVRIGIGTNITISGNTISANGSDGIVIGGDQTNLDINTNIIGLDINGQGDMVLDGDGVTVTSDNTFGNQDNGIVLNLVDGSSSGNSINGNLISGNGIYADQNSGSVGIGIYINADTRGFTIQDNVIGLEGDEVTPQKNINSGIYISGLSNSVIGGTGANETNLIAHNGDYGIEKLGAHMDGIPVFANEFVCNEKGGISFTSTPIIDAPVITLVSPSSISGTTTAEDNSNISIYEADSCGVNQGKQLVLNASNSVSGGNWSATGSFDLGKNYVAVVVDDETAINDTLSISEFSASASIPPSVVVNTNDAGTGSLRDAITYANANPGTTITFDFPGAGPWTIQLATPLPTITTGMTIDGTTAPLYNRTSGVMVTLDGNTNSVAQAIVTNPGAGAGDLTVRGLRFNGFLDAAITQTSSAQVFDNYTIEENVFVNLALGATEEAIWVDDATNLVVNNNFIGVDFDGVTAGDITGSGLLIDNNIANATISNNTLGNLGYDAVYRAGGIGTDTLTNNLVGLVASGTQLANSGGLRNGFVLESSSNTAFLGNYIVGTGNDAVTAAGLRISVAASNLIIRNNTFGEDFDTDPFANRKGISIDNSVSISSIHIGGAATQGNIIAHSTEEAILVDGNQSNQIFIRSNSIYNNTSGIVLNGANGGIAPAIIGGISAADVNGTGVIGETVHLYASDVNGQGQSLLDSAVVAGDNTWSITGLSLTASDSLVVTATGSSGTSEFSTIYSYVPSSVTNTNDAGPGSLREVINYANANPGTTITFDIPGGGPWVINLATELPDVTAQGTIIDGTTQPGWDILTANMPTVDGGGTLVRGLDYKNNNVALYGMHMTNFTVGVMFNTGGTSANGYIFGAPGKGNIFTGNSSNGIQLLTYTGGGTIQSNYFGILPDSVSAGFSNGIGINIGTNGDKVQIGGLGANEGNVVANNTTHQIGISNADSVTVQGNIVGLSADETIAPGVGNGISISALNAARIEQNVIGGVNMGIRISAANSSTIIRNNIGVASDSTAAFGNVNGIRVLTTGATNNIIGSNTVSADGNIIAYSSSEAILFDNASATGNQIQRNEMYGNTAGIVLNGSHNGIVSPSIDPITSDSTATGTGTNGDVIDLYLADSLGHGEKYLGSATVSGGTWSIGSLSLIGGDQVVATATNATDGTSEFSTPAPFIFNYPSAEGAGEALSFDGSNDFVDLGTKLADGLSAITVEAWINPNTVTPGGVTGSDIRTIISEGTLEAGNTALFIGFAGDNSETQLYATVDAGGGLQLATYAASNISLNEWTHLAMTWTSGDVVKLYVNGEEVAQSPVATGSIISVANDFAIGRSYNTGEDYFDGEIDEVRVWDFAKTDEEIRGSLAQKITGGSSGLIGYFPMDDSGDLGTLLDYDGVINGTIDGASYVPSGAHLGDYSTYEYSYGAGSGRNLDAFRVDNLGVPNLPLHIYRVSGTPTNNVVSGFDNIADTTYYGVFAPGQTYDVVDSIGSLTADRRILYRADGADTTWTSISGVLGIRLEDDQIYAYGQSGSGQFVTAIDQNPYPTPVDAGYALSFNGSGDLIAMGSDPSLQITGPLTYEFWINTTASTGYVIGRRNSDAAAGIASNLEILGDGRIQLVTNNGATTSVTVQSTASINDGSWHHVAAVYEPSAYLRIYVDGLLSGENTSGIFANLNPASLPFHLAFRHATTPNYFAGQLDEVRVWDIALGQNSIRDHMIQKIDADFDSLNHLVAYYRFDENSGSVAANLAGDSDGTVTGATPVISGVPQGQGSIYSYQGTPGILNTGQFGEDINVYYDDATGGIHGYVVQGNPNQLQADGFNNLDQGKYYGVFAPAGQKVDLHMDYSGGNDTNRRIVYRKDATDTAAVGGWERLSGLLNTSDVVDSVFAFNVPSGEVTTAVLNPPSSYPLLGTTDPGDALDFDGVDDHVVVDDIFDAIDSLSIEVWINPSSAQGGEGIIVSQSTSSVAEGWELRRIGTTIQLTFRSSNSTQYTASNTLTPDTWQHVAGVWDGSNIIVYVDGVAGSSAGTAGNIPDNARNLIIGNHDGNARFFQGQIDEVRIWNAALTQTEITTYANANTVLFHPNYSDLLAYYRFDDGTGSTILEDVFGNNDGTLTNMDENTDWIASGALAGAPQENALNFDGTDDFLSIARTQLPTGLTFEAWIQTSSTDTASNYTGNAALSVIGDMNNDVGLSFGITDGKVVFNHFDGSSWNALQGNALVNDSTWHHIAATHDQTSGDVLIYVDGVLDITGNISYDASYHHFNRIGSSYNAGIVDGDFFDGSIDEVRIWNTVIDEVEIRDHLYASDLGSHPNNTNLVLHYNFNQGDAGNNNSGESTVADLSSNTLDGTLNGFTLNGASSNFISSNAFVHTPSASSIQATNISVSNVTETTADITWTNGDGQRRIVAIFEGIESQMPIPADNQFLGADPMFMSGDLADSSWYTVYNGFGDSISVTGLTSGQDYTIAVLEVNGPAGQEAYNSGADTDNPLNFSTNVSSTNYALEFDGSAQYVEIADAPQFDIDTAWTIEAWIKTPSTGQQNIVSQVSGNTGYAFFKSGGTLYFQYYSSGGFQNGGTALDIAAGIDDDQWHHVAVSQNGSNGKIYVDGSPVLDVNVLLPIDETTGSVRFGQDPFVGGYTGVLDEVRFWDYQRSDTEIVDHYVSELNGDEAGLVAYYPFTDGPGDSTLTDATGNGNVGILNAMDVNTDWVEGPILNPPAGPNPLGEDFNSDLPTTTDQALFLGSGLWEGQGVKSAEDSTKANGGTGDAALMFFGTGNYLTTPSLDAVNQFTFYYRAENAGGNGFVFDVFTSSDGGITFDQEIASDSSNNTTTYKEFNYNFGSPYTGPIRIVYDALGSESGYIDDFYADAEVLRSDVTITTLPVGDTTVNAGDQDILIYKVQVDIANASAAVEGMFLTILGADSTDFDLEGFKFFESINIDDFGSATLIDSSSWSPGDPVPNGSIGQLFTDFYVPGTTVYYYVTADISALANPGTFNVDIPDIEQFGFGDTNKFDGGLTQGDNITIQSGTTPLAPSDFSIIEELDGSVTFDWTDNATDEIDYIIEQSTDNAVWSSFSGSLGVDTSSYNSGPLSSETAFWWRVVAVGTGGNAFSASRYAGNITLPGNALDFDGVDDHVSIGDIHDFSSPFTIEAWVSRATTGTPDWVVSNGSTPVNTGEYLHFGFRSGDQLSIDFFGDGVSSVETVTDADWHHIAAVYDGANIGLYLDGDSLTVADPSITPFAGVGDFRIGQAFDTEFFQGQIDEVRVWSRDLTQAEIQANLYNTLDGSEPNLMVYYRFDHSAEFELADYSESNISGFLQSMDTSDWVASGALTQVVPDATFATVPVTGGNLNQGSTDNLIYQFSISAAGGIITKEGMSVAVGGNATNADFSANGWKLYESINTDTGIGGASLIGSTNIGDFAADTVAFAMSGDIQNGDTHYFYLAVDVDPAATPGNAFNVVLWSGDPTETVGIADPKNKIDGGFVDGETFTIQSSDTESPTPVISSTESSPTNANPIPIDIDFGEVVIGFDSTDLVVVNGTAQNFVDIDGQSYTVEVVPVSDGTVTIDIADSVAQDLAGNESLIAAQFTIDFDGTGPSITFDQDGLTVNDTNLSGTISDPTDVIQISVDGGSTLSSGSNEGDGTWSYDLSSDPNFVGDALYNIYLDVVDTLGNQTILSTGTVTIDQTGPSVSVDSLLTNNTSPEITGTIDDELATVNVTIDGNLYSAVVTTGAWTISEGTIAPPLSDGVYDVQVIATDSASNIGNDSTTSELTIDTTAPIVTIDFLTTSESSPELTGTVDDILANVELIIVSNTYTATNNGDSTWTLSAGVINPPLTDDTYDVQVSATDILGNVGNDATTDELTVDVSGPSITFDQDGATTNDTNLTGTVSDPTDVIQISVDGGTTLSAVSNEGDGTWSYDLSTDPNFVGDALYNIYLDVVDTLGNQTILSTGSIVINQNGPVITFDQDGLTTNDLNLTGTISDPSEVIQISTDGGTGFASVTNNGDGTWMYDLGTDVNFAGDGTYSIYLDAVDTVGNQTVFSSGSVTIDQTAPIIEVDILGTSLSSPSITGTIDDISATIEVTVDGQTNPAANVGDGTWMLAAGTLTDLADGTYDVSVSATDVVGNVGTDQTIDELVITQEILALQASKISSTSFRANWSEGLDVQSYQIDVSRESDFSTFVAGYENVSVPLTNRSLNITGLDFSTTYYYRVRLVNTASQVSANSNVRTVKTVVDLPTLADSLALVQIHEAINPQGLNWETARLRDWDGVTLDDNRTRVAVVNISGTQAAGDMPNPFVGDALTNGGLSELTGMDISVNEITGLIDYSGTSLATLFVNENALQFDDLEPVVALNITELDYSDQASVQYNETTDGSPIEVRYTNSYSLSIGDGGAGIGGSENEYTWFRNDATISSGDDFAISDAQALIISIDYDNMGTFRTEVTSTLVPGLTIEVDPQIVWAVADMVVTVVDEQGDPLEDLIDGYMLEAVRRAKGFDTLEVVTNAPPPSFTFPDVVLGNYIIAMNSNPELYIPTYYGDVFEWGEADTLFFRSDDGITMTMTEVPPELVEGDGDGTLDILIEEDFGEDDARIDARRRAAKRKCGLRRKRSGGRTGQDDDEFELIAYGETDENGEFQFGFLPEGTYRFFVEYPGIPLDESSFVEFEVGEAGVSDTDFKLQAFASEDGIEVTIEAVLGVILDYFKNLKIYPNPSSDYLNIAYRHLKSGDVTAQLVDLTGNTLWSLDLRNGFDGQVQIDVKDFEEGVYILRFYDRENPQDNVVSFRIIVSQ